VTTLAEAMKTIKGSFETGVIKGTKQKADKYDYVVPYKGKVLLKLLVNAIALFFSFMLDLYILI